MPISDHELTKDTLYFIHTDQLGSVFCEYFGENEMIVL